MFVAIMCNLRCSRVVRCLLGIVLWAALTGWSTESEAVLHIPLGPCNNPKAKHLAMYYMNGVDTTLTRAIENYLALRSLMRTGEMTSTLNAAGVCVELGYKYNPSANAIQDFIEAGQQLNELLTPSFLRQWFVLYGASIAALSASSPAVAALLLYIGSKAGDSDLIDKAVIDTQSTALMSDLLSCRNVLLVPHSQGNLYAHQEHDLLFNKLKSLSPPHQELQLNGLYIVGVASPDAAEAVFSSPTGYGIRYFWRTSHSDLVMGAVTLYLKTKSLTRLESNTDWSSSPYPFWAKNSFGHAFEGYLGSQNARNHILDRLKDRIAALPRGACPKFSEATYVATNAAANIAVVRGPSLVVESVGFSTQPPSGTSAAVPGQDYTPISRSVDFTANGTASDTLVNVPVTILKNPNRTSKRFVPLLLSQGSSNTPLGAKMTAVLEIPPDTSTACVDLAPDITALARAEAGDVDRQEVMAPGPVSVSASAGQSAATASGSKGGGSVASNATMMNFVGTGAKAQLSYTEYYKITSPSKAAGSLGTAVVTATGSATTSANCDSQGASSAGASIRDPDRFVLGFNANFHCGTSEEGHAPMEQSKTVNFSYGSVQSFLVGAGAESFIQGPPWGPSPNGTTSATANIGYSISVQNDPQAQVTWCRATQ